MKRYSKIMLPQKYSPHELKIFPQIRKNLENSIILNNLDVLAKNQKEWQTSEIWKYAIDLFNHGYYWETHGIVELIWNELDKDCIEAKFLQGFIQSAACLVKFREKNKAGVKRLLSSSEQNLAHKTMFGLDSMKLINDTQKLVKGKTKDWPKIILL